MQQQSDNPPRLENFPISFFATVMGFAGLTIAWEKAQHLAGMDLHITPLLVGATAAVFGVLVVLYAAKAMRYRKAVLAELHHPIKLNFFPAMSISLLLLAIAFLPLNAGISRPLWMLGTAAHLLLTFYVVNVWFHHEHFEVHHINPAWFIPAVGNVLVPVAGVPLGYAETSWFFFSVGMLFWVMLMTIIFYRVLFHHPIDQKLMPTLFILIAPPAVGFIAYIRLAGELDAFARILYYSGLFLTLLLLTQARRFLKLSFFLSWWAYSFPLAAISIASMLMYELTGAALYAWTGGGLLALLSAVVLLLTVRTAMAVSRHRICVPGH
jgi:tellurite resistance protein